MEAERKKRKFNAVDVVIIVVIAAVLCFLGYKFLIKGDSIVTPTAEITYKVLIKNAEKESLESIMERDLPMQLIAGESYVANAYIVDIEYKDSENSIEIFSTDTGIKTRALEGKVDIIFTVTAVVEDKANVEVSTQEIRIGKTNYLKTKYLEMSGTVISVAWA